MVLVEELTIEINIPGLSVGEILENTPTLINMIDLLGREQKEHNKGSLLFYIYDNGKVDKKFNP